MIKALFYKGLGVNERKRVRGCDNSTYPKGGVSCSKDTFLQAVSSVLRIKFSGENPTVRVAAKRQVVKKLRIPKTQQDKISKFWFSGILL